MNCLLMTYRKVELFTGLNRELAMKVQASVKKRNPDDKIVVRKGRVYVINKKNPRFKQRQG